jgi:hypothetical protein
LTDLARIQPVQRHVSRHKVLHCCPAALPAIAATTVVAIVIKSMICSFSPTFELAELTVL